MKKERLVEILEAVQSGSLTIESAAGELADLPFTDLGFARVDNHRALRCGFPEVIFCPGKLPEEIAAIATRLAEECGEVAAEVNHFERQGVKVERRGAPDRRKLAKELQDVMGAVLHLAIHYELQDELAASVNASYERVVAEGLVEPLEDDEA
mgnify:CR=1 FL=1